MARTDPQINIRIPERLRAMLDEARERSGRSLTGEIAYQLEQAFQGAARLSAAEARNERLLNEIVRAQELIIGLDAKFAAGVQALNDSAPEIYRKRAAEQAGAASTARAPKHPPKKPARKR